MARDLALLIPEIAVLLTAVGALIAEMLRRPQIALLVAVSGLIVATGLTVSLIGEDTTVFGGSFRVDDLSVWAKLILLPATILATAVAMTGAWEPCPQDTGNRQSKAAAATLRRC